ncbi:MAG: DEAD/DEAH box helicase, partial [Ilumatobacter sp.]|nr:DEAD/DEAH box helicase [Ilumatobacter sp.]
SGDQLSPSLAWFAQLTQFAVRLVAARRLVPEVVDEGPFTVARWRPVLDDVHEQAIAHAAASAPPICRNGSSATTGDIVSALVDGLSRAVLHHAGWKPDLGRKRSVEIQAARGVFAALGKPDPVIRSGSDEFARAVAETASVLDRHRRRLAGEPVVRGRVRLTLPNDARDPWLIDLELVDDADPGRWCTVADLQNESARALDLAGGSPSRLGALREEAVRLVTAVADAVPMLEEVGAPDHDGHVELDIEEADDFIEQAPLQLEQANIELIGPEHLVRAKVSVKGTAREGPTDDRRSRFGKEALVEWEAVIDETPISMADLERAEAAGVSLLRTGHRWVRIDTAALRKARKTLSEQVEEQSSISALELLRLMSGAGGDDDLPIELELADDLADGADDSDEGADASWLHELVAGLPDDRLQETTEGDGFVGELRHYQRRALSWMQFLARTGLGGCLADDMGLGKTATTLAHLLERPGPHLVVCPLSVVHNWEAEAHRFTPGRTVIVHHGADRHQGEPALFGLGDADIVITTYGLLPRDLDSLAAIDWTTVVLDEAQMVKNPATKAAKAVRKLRAAQKLALTGTPVENRLSELWAILDACNPGLLGSQQRFREEFATAIERNNSEEAAARLRQLTQPFVLRRTKADRRLLPDLPDKIEQIAYAQLTKEQATLYQGVVDQLLVDAKDLEGMQRRGRVLAALTRLKQICNHPAHALKDGSRLAGRSGKLNRFDELITELLDVDERALVFTQFREMGDLLQIHLQSRFEMQAPFLHGGVAKARRDRMVAEFQEGLGAPLLIVSLKAGGTGLNLTAASQVIHYDRWWNPAVEDQATDRAWRLGQQRTVNVHKLVCQGTVEERIGQVIDDKRAIADAVIGNGEAWLSELSTDELADLVTLEVPR